MVGDVGSAPLDGPGARERRITPGAAVSCASELPERASSWFLFDLKGRKPSWISGAAVSACDDVVIGGARILDQLLGVFVHGKSRHNMPHKWGSDAPESRLCSAMKLSPDRFEKGMESAFRPAHAHSLGNVHRDHVTALVRFD